MQERNQTYNKYQISVCKNYDPSKDKNYNNRAVAFGWDTTTLEWSEKSVREFTTQQATSCTSSKLIGQIS